MGRLDTIALEKELQSRHGVNIEKNIHERPSACDCKWVSIHAIHTSPIFIRTFPDPSKIDDIQPCRGNEPVLPSVPVSNRCAAGSNLVFRMMRYLRSRTSSMDSYIRRSHLFCLGTVVVLFHINAGMCVLTWGPTTMQGEMLSSPY